MVRILAPDLEWWFHGPPSHQFLMRTLTGDTTAVDTFRFVPQTVISFGSTVIVEGCDTSRAISWVHALTVVDGIVTQVREYFNTSLTVTHFAGKDSGEIVPATNSGGFPCVWESSVSDRVGKSVPGLVLAI